MMRRYKQQPGLSRRTVITVIVIVAISAGVIIPVSIFAFQGSFDVGNYDVPATTMKDGIFFDLYSENDDIIAKSPVIFTRTWNNYIAPNTLLATKSTTGIIGQITSTGKGAIACKFPVPGKIGDSIKISGYLVNAHEQYIIADVSSKVIVTLFLSGGFFQYYDQAATGVIGQQKINVGDYYSLTVEFYNITNYKVTLFAEGNSYTKTPRYYFGASMTPETQIGWIAFNSNTVGVAYQLKYVMTSWKSDLSSIAFVGSGINIEDKIANAISTESGEPSTVIQQVNNRVVEVDARYWSPWSTPTQSGVMYSFTSLENLLWIKESPTGNSIDLRLVICDETKLKSILGVQSLYMANGSPYIFKGLNAHNGYTSNQYDSIAVVTKGPNITQPNGAKANGAWYVRPWSIGLNWPYVLSQLMAYDNIYIPPPPKQDTEIDASKWFSGGGIYGVITTTSWGGIGVKTSSISTAGTERVLVDEATLSSKIGHALYNSAGLPYIFKGLIGTTGIGFLFRHSDGNWYMRALSIGIDLADANAKWPYTLAQLYLTVYNIPK